MFENLAALMAAPIDRFRDLVMRHYPIRHCEAAGLGEGEVKEVGCSRGKKEKQKPMGR